MEDDTEESGEEEDDGMTSEEEELEERVAAEKRQKKRNTLKMESTAKIAARLDIKPAQVAAICNAYSEDRGVDLQDHPEEIISESSFRYKKDKVLLLLWSLLLFLLLLSFFSRVSSGLVPRVFVEGTREVMLYEVSCLEVVCRSG